MQVEGHIGPDPMVIEPPAPPPPIALPSCLPPSCPPVALPVLLALPVPAPPLWLPLVVVNSLPPVLFGPPVLCPDEHAAKPAAIQPIPTSNPRICCL
jgi:hypothetical protein